jgi:hypothetical protein
MTKWDVIHELINQHGPGRDAPPYWVLLLGGLLAVLALSALCSIARRPLIYAPRRIIHKAPAVPAWDERPANDGQEPAEQPQELDHRAPASSHALASS